MKQLTLLFLLLGLLAGVQSADKELNEACISSDTCVHPTLELACSTGKCLIKDGQACDENGNDVLCVAGAECSTTSNTCTCKTPTYKAASGTCTVAEDKWAGACPSSGTCTAASNLVCTNSLCLCSPDFAPDLTDGTCSTAISNEKIGKECKDIDKDTTCGNAATTFLECPSGGGTCACQTGYTGLLGGGCTAISTNKRVGKACTPGTSGDEATTCGTASSTLLSCSSGACACAANYTGVTGGQCYPAKGALGGGCSGTGQGTCATAGTYCTGTPNKCTTIPNEKIGATCTKDNKDTTCGTTKHMECPSAGGHCACVDGYTGPIGGDCSIQSAAIEVIGSMFTVMLLATVTLLYTC